MARCKGYCRTKYGKFVGQISLRYNGQKRCGTCDVYLKWNGSKCPCCGSVLHVRPRHSRFKTKYYEAEKIKWI